MTLKLDHKPVLVIQYPLCGTCQIDVEADPDGLTCPNCGTWWSHKAGDGEAGELPDDWDELPGEPIPESTAHILAVQEEMRQREEFLERMLHR